MLRSVSMCAKWDACNSYPGFDTSFFAEHGSRRGDFVSVLIGGVGLSVSFHFDVIALGRGFALRRILHNSVIWECRAQASHTPRLCSLGNKSKDEESAMKKLEIG
ncbi:hypothetical protein KC19_12G121200 [Ceratodon purpureus]|uniref:Uncharacterized protein n=1 Tax=Ceratodon purpureus TaxID=3225 RepID=A0A8T0G6E3_CERPU|nr:hypothetical protein KC19_12G121200 [Ceratodon purpureus]